MRHASPRAARLLAGLALASLLSACNAGRGQYASLEGFTPDPSLKTATKSNLKGRVGHACVVTQARLQGVAEASVEQPCGCYADRTLATLDAGEIQSYRTTGYFNDSARAKAMTALDACRLPRPA